MDNYAALDANIWKLLAGEQHTKQCFLVRSRSAAVTQEFSGTDAFTVHSQLHLKPELSDMSRALPRNDDSASVLSRHS